MNHQREVRAGGRTLCRARAGERYYTVLDGGGAAGRPPRPCDPRDGVLSEA